MTIEEIIKEISLRIKSISQNIDVNPGTMLYNCIIYPIAYILSVSFGIFDSYLSKVNIITATGSDLDAIASNYGIIRHTGTSASGVVRFYYRAQNQNPINFISGALRGAYGSTSIEYSCNYAMVIPANGLTYDGDVYSKYYGYYYFNVSVMSNILGVAGNVPTGAINSYVYLNIDSFPVYIYNPTPIYNGVDGETDADFRERIISSFNGNFGTKSGYKSLVLNNFSVRDVNVISGNDSDSNRKYSSNTVDIIVIPYDSSILEYTVIGDGSISFKEYSFEKPVIDYNSYDTNYVEFYKDNYSIYSNSYLENGVLRIKGNAQFKYYSSPLIRSINDFLINDSNNIIGSDVLVKSASRYAISIKVSAKVKIGYVFSNISTELNSAIDSYIKTLKIGDSLQTTDIIDICYNVPGIDYVDVEIADIKDLSGWVYNSNYNKKLDGYSYFYCNTNDIIIEEI